MYASQSIITEIHYFCFDIRNFYVEFISHFFVGHVLVDFEDDTLSCLRSISKNVSPIDQSACLFLNLTIFAFSPTGTLLIWLNFFYLVLHVRRHFEQCVKCFDLVSMDTKYCACASYKKVERPVQTHSTLYSIASLTAKQRKNRVVV